MKTEQCNNRKSKINDSGHLPKVDKIIVLKDSIGSMCSTYP